MKQKIYGLELTTNAGERNALLSPSNTTKITKTEFFKSEATRQKRIEEIEAAQVVIGLGHFLVSYREFTSEFLEDELPRKTRSDLGTQRDDLSELVRKMKE